MLTILSLFIYIMPAHAEYEEDHLTDEQRAGLRLRSLHQLENALRSALDTDDIDLLKRIAETSIRTHGKSGVPMVKQIKYVLAKRQSKPRHWPLQATLAALVAPFDAELRDELLTEAVTESRRASAIETPTPPEIDGCVDQYEMLVEFQRELWECVVRHRLKPELSGERLCRLLRRAKEAGYIGTCVPKRFDAALLEEMCKLDPRLVFEVWSETQPPEKLNRFCVVQARDALGPFAEILITHAVNNGEQSVEALKKYRFYDLEGAYRIARQLPGKPRGGLLDRSTALKSILELWAWQDPDKALELAERETHPTTRRDLVETVSRVWAYKRPRDIERAVQHQDNEVRREWARKRAASELDRRRRGLVPRDSPDRVAPTGGRRRRLCKTPPPDEKQRLINEYWKNLQEAKRGHDRALYAHLIYQLDPERGDRAISMAIEKSAVNEYTTMTVFISRISPTHLLRIYKANPNPKKLYSLQFFRVLAQADPAFAEKEARQLAKEEQTTALKHVAAGIAPSDWQKGWELLKEAGYDEKEGVPIDFGEHYLVANPKETSRIRGWHRQTILNQAAYTGYRQSLTLNVMEAIISSLSDRREVDQVLRYCARGIAQWEDPAVAEKLADRIRDSSVSCIARCELARNMLKNWY